MCVCVCRGSMTLRWASVQVIVLMCAELLIHGPGLCSVYVLCVFPARMKHVLSQRNKSRWKWFIKNGQCFLLLLLFYW